MPKIVACEQGSALWASLRAGKPCSSEFHRIITPTGKASKSASDYCDCLLVETMLGRPLGVAEMPWMIRGKELEAEAVRFYELTRSVETVPVGLVLTDDERIASSPDRLIGDSSLLEIKCPSETIHARYLINALLSTGEGIEAEYRVQLHGQLLVTDREWVDIESYSPGMPEAVVRVERDVKFIALMKTQLQDFLNLFDARLAKLSALGCLDEIMARKAKVQRDEGIEAFGLSQADVESYIAGLKKDGVLPTEGVTV